MNKKHFLVIFCVLFSIVSFAQQKEKMTREDKDEKNAARTTRIKDKTDYNLFHRQMLSLKEYNDERKKIPNLQKANKMTVKIVPVIDSLDDVEDAAAKTLVGYIRQDIGDNSTNLWEVTFDRAQKKIISVKHTAEAIDADKEAAEEKAEKATEKKPPVKATARKKKGDDDDDDDADDDKPVKSKKSKDDDD